MRDDVYSMLTTVVMVPSWWIVVMTMKTMLTMKTMMILITIIQPITRFKLFFLNRGRSAASLAVYSSVVIGSTKAPYNFLDGVQVGVQNLQHERGGAPLGSVQKPTSDDLREAEPSPSLLLRQRVRGQGPREAIPLRLHLVAGETPRENSPPSSAVAVATADNRILSPRFVVMATDGSYDYGVALATGLGNVAMAFGIVFINVLCPHVHGHKY